jgi:hypothetical protein
MEIIIKTKDEDKAKRLIHCDDAFRLIWEISQKLREYNKYQPDKTRDEIIDELNELIGEENILELYN